MLTKSFKLEINSNGRNGDFMTSHGWGGICVASSLGNIAKEVSKVKGVRKAVVVHGPDYDIIVQIDLRKHPTQTLQGLLADIYNSSPSIQRVDAWIGQDEYYYENGKKIKI